MKPLILYPGTRFPLHIAFGTLTGQDELYIASQTGTDNEIISVLLSRMITHIKRGEELSTLSDLTLYEFDQCLAHALTQIYGGHAPCEADCKNCGSAFEFSLDMQTIQKNFEKQVSKFGVPGEDILQSKNGKYKFRLPRLSDLTTLTQDNRKDWIKSFLVSGSFNYNSLQKDIDAASPPISMEIKADCPECEHINSIHFDIANYYLQTLRNEQTFLLREVHLIAQTYRWPLSEILSMDRNSRQQFARLITADVPGLRQAS